MAHILYGSYNMGQTLTVKDELMLILNCNDQAADCIQPQF